MSKTLSDFNEVRIADVGLVLRRNPNADLTNLLHALPGYWPGDVVRDLRQIERSASEEAAAARRALTQLEHPARDPDIGDEVRRLLPVPHPLDADWRFTVRTRELLLDIADSHSARQETLLLGTPSIFAHMCAQLDLRAAVLVDANRATVEAANRLAEGHALLGAQEANLLAGADIGLAPIFDTVIADPPWYFAEHRSFLDAASALLVPEGIILMAAAPNGTRPGAEADREELLAHAVAAGFDLVDTMPGVLEYTSSPFERAALRECGLASVPTNWRRADLLVSRKSNRTPAGAVVGSLRPSDWLDRFSGRTRLKLHQGNMPTSPEVDHFSGSVSASVSRLASERGTANLWTSGNGAFNVNRSLIDSILVGDPGWQDSASGRALLDALAREAADLREWGWM